ncbi:MAG: alanine dehydrogenase [Sulfuricurvum sp. PC08-66]|nr:MAG: alanine dehydrogenase [Sulfuricurvum sp. PC08-66]
MSISVVGLPKEIKTDEFRVALTPSGVASIAALGVRVVVQKGAGIGSGFEDSAYIDAGANMVDTIDSVYAQSDLIIKVKEPIQAEYTLLKPHQTLFTYLHLAADKPLTQLLLDKKITAFAYETLTLNGRLPLLEPMSEVAGKMSTLMGAVHLGRYQGGSGRLLGGVVGVERNHLLVLGGGVAGMNAAMVGAGMGANVTILELNKERLNYLAAYMPANVTVRYSSHETLFALLPSADVVIGTVLIAGEKAPKLITRDMLRFLQKGSVLVDVSIDQGGCFETSHPTTHTHPTYEVDGIVHYCVANMPGAYPRTSTLALTSATLPYIRTLIQKGVEEVLQMPTFASALNCYEGRVTNEGVKKALGV